HSLVKLHSLGAEAAAAVVARSLRARGARGISRGPRSTTKRNPAHLTVRELEVLDLVNNGMRNAEIASRLFLTPKTVDHHVSAIRAVYRGIRRASRPWRERHEFSHLSNVHLARRFRRRAQPEPREPDRRGGHAAASVDVRYGELEEATRGNGRGARRRFGGG